MTLFSLRKSIDCTMCETPTVSTIPPIGGGFDDLHVIVVSACLPLVQNAWLFCIGVGCLAPTIAEMCLDHLQCHLASVRPAVTVAVR